MPTKVDFKDVFRSLWVGWIVNFGSISAFAACGLFIPDKWMPFFGFSLLLVIWIYANKNLLHHRHNCSLLNYYTIYTISLCATSMLVINLTHTHWFHDARASLNLNQQGPFISSMWVMTFAAILYAIALWRRGKPAYCHACKAQNDTSVQYALKANVYHREMILQLRMMFWLCLIMSAIGWAYYSFFYINVNINVSDAFFYYIIPMVVFGLSVIYLAVQYSNLHFEAVVTPAVLNIDSCSQVRFMIVRGEKIMLKEVARDHGANLGMWDTPAVATLPDAAESDLGHAHDIFANLSGTEHFALRDLFVTSSQDCRVAHYAVFLDHDDTEMPRLQGNWFNLYEIDMMMRTGLVARPFAYAMHRVYTMTLAWKTYDTNGKRLYPIKNYRPTFRLSDFKDWDVDYNDLQWLNIAKYNEDMPFFRLRKFWRTYITRADLLWRSPR